MPLIRPPKGGVGRESRSGGKQKSKQSAVKSSGQAAAKSGQEGNVNQFAHDRSSPSLRRQLVLERDALELFAEVLDPIPRLLALHRGHESRNRIRAASRAQHAVLGMVVDDGPDLELVGHYRCFDLNPSSISARIAADRDSAF